MIDVEEYDDLDDIPVKEDNLWDKIVEWIAGHKVLFIVTVIGLPVLLFVLGAKLFSKTVEVEKLPDPTVMDRFDCVPQDMTTYTTYKFVPKEVVEVKQE